MHDSVEQIVRKLNLIGAGIKILIIAIPEVVSELVG
jgi:hypothetical protein